MHQAIRILVVMDPLRRYALLEKLEISSAEIYTTSNIAAAGKLLREVQRLDIVISETSLADGNWLGVQREVKQYHPAAEMIVCVPAMGREAGEALKQGADDLIVLSHTLEECQRIIESAAARTYMRSLTSTSAAAAAV